MCVSHDYDWLLTVPMSGSSVQVMDVYANAQILLFDISACMMSSRKTEGKKHFMRDYLVCVRCGIGCASKDVLSIEAAYSTKHQAGLGVCASSGSEQ